MATRTRWFRSAHKHIAEIRRDEPVRTRDLFEKIRQNMDRLFPDLVVLGDKFV